MRLDTPGIMPDGATWESWVDLYHRGRVVATALAVGDGTVAHVMSEDVPERLDARIVDPGRVVAADGQDAQVWTRVTYAGREWTFPVGRFRLMEVEHSDGITEVLGHGLRRKIAQHMARDPYGVGNGATVASALASIAAADDVEVIVGSGLRTAAVPRGFSVGRDRFEAFTALVGAWPAVVRTDGYGRLGMIPPVPVEVTSRPVIRWHDGDGGTVQSAPITTTSSEIFNHFIVPVEGRRAGEYVIRHGRLAVDSYGWVSTEITSDADTSSQADLIARAEAGKYASLARTRRVAGQVDWSAEIWDPVEVTADGVTTWGVLLGYERPLTPDSGTSGMTDEIVGVTD